jgi:hypothetical protein
MAKPQPSPAMKETMATGRAKPWPNPAVMAADRLIAQWPERLDSSALPLLGHLTAASARRLADQLLAALPTGRLGSAEANRLRALLSILRVLPARPSRRRAQVTLARYCQRIVRSKSAHLPEIESAV